MGVGWTEAAGWVRAWGVKKTKGIKVQGGKGKTVPTLHTQMMKTSHANKCLPRKMRLGSLNSKKILLEIRTANEEHFAGRSDHESRMVSS